MHILKYDLLYISTEHYVHVIINFQDPNFDFCLWTVTVILENCLINGPAHGVFNKPNITNINVLKSWTYKYTNRYINLASWVI